MLSVMLLLLFSAIPALIVANRLIPTGLLADYFCASSLVFFLCFYGWPISIGWLTGRMDASILWVGATLNLAVGSVILWKAGSGPWNWNRVGMSLRSLGWPHRLIIAYLSVMLLALLWLSSRFPIRTWDAVTYHSLNPMRWAETGRFLIDSYSDLQPDFHRQAAEVFPNVKAILPFAVMELGGSEEGTALCQWPFLVMLLGFVYAISRRMGNGRTASLMAVVLTAHVPEILLQSVEAYADIMFVCGLMAVCWTSLVVLHDGFEWRMALPAAAAFAILAGSKPTGILYSGVLGVGFLSIMVMRHWREGWRRQLPRTAGTLGLILLVCFLTSGPWYMNGILRFRNPIYPVAVDIGPIHLPGPYSSKIVHGQVAAQQKAKGIHGWWLTMREDYRHPIISNWKGGLGPSAMILGLPSILLFSMLGWLDRDRRMVGFFLGFLALIWLVTPVANWARFILFEPVLWFIAFGWCWDYLGKCWRLLAGSAVAALTFLTLLLSVPSLHYRFRPPELFFYPILTGHTRGMMVNGSPDGFSALDYWREVEAGPGQCLAYYGSNLPWLAKPRANKGTVLIAPNPSENTTTQEWHRQLLALGATHVHARIPSPIFQRMEEHPDLFELVIRRRDDNTESRWYIERLPEDALFRIIPPREDQQ